MTVVNRSARTLTHVKQLRARLIPAPSNPPLNNQQDTDMNDHDRFPQAPEPAHAVVNMTTAPSATAASLHPQRHGIDDTVIQRLFAIGLGLHRVATLLNGQPDARRYLEQAIDDLDETILMASDMNRPEERGRSALSPAPARSYRAVTNTGSP